MEPRARIRRDRRGAIVAAVLGAAFAASLGAAQASDGAGVGTPDPPKLTSVTCLEKCADVRTAAVGSRVRLGGQSLAGVDEVRFAAAGGGRVAAAPSSSGASAVEV